MLSLVLDPRTRQPILRIVDPKTREVLRQFPGDALLRLAKRLRKSRETGTSGVRRK